MKSTYGCQSSTGWVACCYILYDFMSEVNPPLGEPINYNLSADMMACYISESRDNR
ncbi:hypothetical protein [Blautia celeris]|uniref:hypothetical protein n=1 Tax=Blautia celeris TaxID=2763026 RepID=UPI0031B9F187